MPLSSARSLAEPRLAVSDLVQSAAQVFQVRQFHVQPCW